MSYWPVNLKEENRKGTLDKTKKKLQMERIKNYNDSPLTTEKFYISVIWQIGLPFASQKRCAKQSYCYISFILKLKYSFA